MCFIVTLFGIVASVIAFFVLNGGEEAKRMVCNTGLVLNVNTDLCEGLEKLKACPVGQWGPDCTACLACGDHGQCIGSGTQSGDGTCLCSLGWTGERCNICAQGFYGPKCTKCDDCSGHGRCNGTSARGNGSAFAKIDFQAQTVNHVFQASLDQNAAKV